MVRPSTARCAEIGANPTWLLAGLATENQWTSDAASKGIALYENDLLMIP
jgi:hypothetical protein